jgi:CBS domain-containing protein
MSRAAYAVTPDSTIKEVESLMADQQIRRVPVVDAARKPIGMITANDLVRDAASALPGLFDRRVNKTLAAIGSQRQPVEQAA